MDGGGCQGRRGQAEGRRRVPDDAPVATDEAVIAGQNQFLVAGAEQHAGMLTV